MPFPASFFQHRHSLLPYYPPCLQERVAKPRFGAALERSTHVVLLAQANQNTRKICTCLISRNAFLHIVMAIIYNLLLEIRYSQELAKRGLSFSSSRLLSARRLATYTQIKPPTSQSEPSRKPQTPGVVIQMRHSCTITTNKPTRA